MKLLTVKGNEMKKLLLALMAVGVCGTAVAYEDVPRNYFGVSVEPVNDSHRIYKATLGSNLSNNVAIEASYLQSGQYHEKKMTGDVHGFEVAGVIKPFQDGLFVKGGITHTTVDGNEQYKDKYMTGSGHGYLLGIGYEHDFTRDFAGNVAYTKYYKLGGITDFNHESTTIGIKYKF